MVVASGRVRVSPEKIKFTFFISDDIFQGAIDKVDLLDNHRRISLYGRHGSCHAWAY